MAGSRSLLCALAAIALTGMVVFPGSAAHASLRGQPDLRPVPEPRSISIGYPWRGRLAHGVLVRESDAIRYVDEYREHQRFYGTWQLVRLIERAALRVAQGFAGAHLALGELSQQQGGRIPGHRSHRSGRDVDLGFYLLDEAGRPATAPTFVRIRRGGFGSHAGQRYRFDVARNWTLLSALLDDDDARVQYVFVAKALSHRLLAYAKANGAPQWLIARARTVMFQPRHGNRHRSHFHVRIYCSQEDLPECRDRPPYYPWYGGQPPNGVTAAVAGAFPP